MLVIVTGVAYNQMNRIHAIGVVVPILNAILICTVMYWGYKNIAFDKNPVNDNSSHSRTEGWIFRKKMVAEENDRDKESS